MRHRGPDGYGIYISEDERVGLGHRRLSIIELTQKGHQPMANEDGTVWITYNGEIYNYKELRKELQNTGHIFKSNSDTEVIIHAYEQWGTECVKKFRGMFAFGIWDLSKEVFFLARDPIGIKPLYFTHAPSGLLFGSEIKAILADPKVKRKVNSRAMSDFFGLSYIFDDETMFEDIMSVPPGCIYTVGEDGAGRMNRYWEMHFDPNHPWNEQELVEQGLKMLEEAVA
ncbi:MAG: asparagine synthetase B, partial [Desulfobacteraceae bacterium]